MKIIQLDSHAANPGDLDLAQWHTIEAPDGSLCEYMAYPRTSPTEVIERAKDADAIIINKVLITDDVMAQLPRLRYVGVLATGYNVVDVAAARRRGIAVTNVPAYSSASVAQLVFAHLLNITNQVARHSAAVSEGAWSRCPDFTFWLTEQQELAGRVMGIIGLGDIGRAVAAIALALGMRVMVAPSLRPGAAPRTSLPQGVTEAASMAEFFATADVVSLHCPLTPQTERIINADTLAMMKPTAIVINTGRGPLIDEQALAAALNDGTIAAAGIDVLRQEPPVDSSPLIAAPNCYITPHIAWATKAARTRLLTVAIDNVKAFIKGERLNRVE